MNLQHWFNFPFILNLIYKQKCLICSCAKVDNLLCKTCAKDINYLSSFPHKIYKEIPIYSACLYDNVIKKLIHLLKFKHKKNASIVLSKVLFKYFQELKLTNDFIIVYPSSYIFKRFQRGFDHMYLIAKEFSNLTGFEFLKDGILKIKNTKPQYKARDRFKNIKNAYKINEKYINYLKDKNILLIDDITTSGATLEEILNLFLNLKIKNITCLTISKSVK